MELQFQKTVVPCLDTVLREVRNTEQTLELRLPDAMPDIGQIIAVWGQVILRSKEWRGDSIQLSGGVMVWVLYAPEDGSPEKCLDGWMPLQIRWDIPPDSREGDIRITTLLRSLDARSVSPRKIMVRAGVAALGEAFSPMEAEVYRPDFDQGQAELLKTAYPLRLMKEAGEKAFLLDEELSLPESAPRPEKIVYCRMEPRILDKKVLGTKAVFRGNGNLHVLFRSPEGQLHSWDFELPFSQFAELRGDHSSEAQMDLSTEVSALELDCDETGRLRLKGGLVAQYLITDRVLLELVEDAYIPGRQVSLETRELELPSQLDSRRETVYAEAELPLQADLVVETLFLPDFPIQRRTGDALELELPGIFQVLCYGEDGRLRSATGRWTGQKTVNAHEKSRLTAIPRPMEPQAALGNGITARAELPLDLTAASGQGLTMVTGIETGEPQPLDPGRPSLILKRVSDEPLWDIAKKNGTTMAAIKKANSLQEDPSPGRMLLIPIS